MTPQMRRLLELKAAEDAEIAGGESKTLTRFIARSARRISDDAQPGSRFARVSGGVASSAERSARTSALERLTARHARENPRLSSSIYSINPRRNAGTIPGRRVGRNRIREMEREVREAIDDADRGSGVRRVRAQLREVAAVLDDARTRASPAGRALRQEIQNLKAPIHREIDRLVKMERRALRAADVGDEDLLELLLNNHFRPLAAGRGPVFDRRALRQLSDRTAELRAVVAAAA